MPGKRQQKEDKEGQTQRALIESQQPATVTHGIRNARLVAILSWISIHVLFFSKRLGLGGTLLTQEDGEQDIGCHLQEFALPVLARRFCEMPACEIAGQREG